MRFHGLLKSAIILGLFGSSNLIFSDGLDFIELGISPSVSFPIDSSSTIFNTSPNIGVFLLYRDLGFFKPGIDAGYEWLSAQDTSTIVSQRIGVLLAGEFLLSSRFFINLDLSGGFYQITRNEQSASGNYFKAGLGVGFKLSPQSELKLSAGYKNLLGVSQSFFQAIDINLSFSIALGSTKGSIDAKTESLDPIFPILHTWYDDNGFGEIEIKNLENGDIENLQVGLFIPQYMDQIKFNEPIEIVEKNGSVKSPIFALFNDNVFRLTEDTKVSGDLQVKYTFLGEERIVHKPISIPVLNRNAMNWSDDRRAAAFVSPKDPAVLRYSKYIAGFIREANDQILPENLSYAIALFEGLKAMGIRYVKDPTTPFIELKESLESIDYLQYPFQTISVKGGDCDDLSILFCSMLESIGIGSAFITVPGHIYCALDLKLSPNQARQSFTTTDDLIFIEDKTYLPVEITILNQGFLKSWQTGASEWRAALNTNEAVIIPIQFAQITYPAVGIPGENGLFALPDSGAILQSWQTSIVEITKREIEPRISDLKQKIAKDATNTDPRIKLANLLVRLNRLKEAEGELLVAIKLGSKVALNNLGQIYLKQKRFNEAIVQLEKAREAFPQEKGILTTLKSAYEGIKNDEKSKKIDALIQSLKSEL